MRGYNTQGLRCVHPLETYDSTQLRREHTSEDASKHVKKINKQVFEAQMKHKQGEIEVTYLNLMI